MVKTKILLYLLGIFIVTIVLIVFLQYNSNRNVNQLIQGNQELLTELQRRIAIHSLRDDLYYISGEERRMVNQQMPALQPEINNRRKKIADEIDYIKKIDGNSKDPKLMRLDSLVSSLLSFHTYVVDTGARNRKLQADLILSGTGDSLLNKVIEASRDLNSSRDERLANIIETTDQNGLEAKQWGIILAILAIVASIYTFFFITNKIRVQEQLIDQLNESEKKVREAARIKENFMANMSHEIRTPMNAILGFTQLLAKESLNQRAEEYVRSIQVSGEHLLTIVNDVLDFSRMEAGMMRIESRPFSLRGLLYSLERMFIEKAKEQGIQLYVVIEDTLPDNLVGDPVRLRQILVNVIGNAIKFTPSGSILIKLTALEKGDDAIEISFTIKDTGIGIPADKIASVFERFNQVDVDASRRFGGTGLGLSIVKQLVEIQDGRIQITSAINKGTEVNFVIPYAMQAQELPVPPFENIPSIESRAFENGISILVIEDNVMNQSLMKYLLGNWNFEFTIASNGAEGIEALMNRDYDLVLMDIQMPGMDGYVTADKIRNDCGLDIPIIAMTAHAMKGEEEKCLLHGMNAYISKPIQEKDLIGLIRQFTVDKKVPDNYQGPIFKTINLKYLLEISAGKSVFIRKMITQFLQQGREDMEALESNFEKGDYPSVKAVAHNLKTSVSFVGLTAKLDLPLSYIEDRVLTEEDGKFMAIAISTVKTICEQALEEAKIYLKAQSITAEAI